MNKTLTTILALAAAATGAVAFAQDAKGDVQAGSQKIAMCIGCHGIIGYQASFPEVYKVPKIAGQSANYIASSLRAYQKGERSYPTMRAIAETLTEQDIADVSAYYAQLGKTEKDASLPDAPAREPSTQVAELLKKGACVSCHGTNFAKPIDPSYPHIAGQNADYLFVALKSYKTEKNAWLGRTNPIMGGIAKQFSNAELKSLAKYIGSVEGDLKVVPESRFR